jgi:5'-nucleotidase
MTTILVTNDDGILAPGLAALKKALQDIGTPIVVAPDRDNSAVSHSLTMKRPLRVQQVEEDAFMVDGTPADCVTLGIAKIVSSRPALIVSGINPGENIGDDVNYSGTVSAAVEGTMLGIPSFAVSLAGEPPFHFNYAAAFAAKLAGWITKHGLPRDTLLNVNIPNGDSRPREIRFTKQGRRTWEGAIKETKDPWGRKHYWIGGGTPSLDHRHDSDAQALVAGSISITPIRLDLTDHEALAFLQREWQDLSG